MICAKGSGKPIQWPDEDESAQNISQEASKLVE